MQLCDQALVFHLSAAHVLPEPLSSEAFPLPGAEAGLAASCFAGAALPPEGCALHASEPRLPLCASSSDALLLGEAAALGDAALLWLWCTRPVAGCPSHLRLWCPPEISSGCSSLHPEALRLPLFLQRNINHQPLLFSLADVSTRHRWQALQASVHSTPIGGSCAARSMQAHRTMLSLGLRCRG